MSEKINSAELELTEHVVHINRVSKVVKGGRHFSFNAIVVVGDGHGHVGVGIGKANELTNAIAKGAESAKKNLVRVPILNGTMPHVVIGKLRCGTRVPETGRAGNRRDRGGRGACRCRSSRHSEHPDQIAGIGQSLQRGQSDLGRTPAARGRRGGGQTARKRIMQLFQ